jgi:tryptophan synthase beta chain
VLNHPAASDRDRPEAIAQLEMADDYPDIVVGCTGGGSNCGHRLPFIGA